MAVANNRKNKGNLQRTIARKSYKNYIESTRSLKPRITIGATSFCVNFMDPRSMGLEDWKKKHLFLGRSLYAAAFKRKMNTQSRVKQVFTCYITLPHSFIRFNRVQLMIDNDYTANKAKGTPLNKVRQ
jgi:hypothetical protein